MNVATPLSTGEARPPDDLEKLLHSYFRAEMPEPWPSPPLASAQAESPSPEATAPVAVRSKLALAASVARLIAGTMLLPSRMPCAETQADVPRMLPGEATRIRLTEIPGQPKNRPADEPLRSRR